RKTRELSRHEGDCRRGDLDRKKPIGPLALGDDLAFDPFTHRGGVTRGNISAIMPVPPSALVAGDSVFLRWPRGSDTKAFVAAVRASERLHGNWVQAPSTQARFAAYLARFAGPRSRQAETATHVGLLACRIADGAPIGVFNLSEIVRGAFQSGYIGYYALAPFAGRGYMSEGLELTLRFAFRALRLHRVEINIQPRNARS